MYGYWTTRLCTQVFNTFIKKPKPNPRINFAKPAETDRLQYFENRNNTNNNDNNNKGWAN